MKKCSLALFIAIMTSDIIATIHKEPITTREGFLFTVKIPDSKIAGTDWYFGNQKELRDYVALIRSESANNSSIASGIISKKVFTFKALKAGRIAIKLIKHKSWEDKEMDHKLIKVTIKKADLPARLPVQP